LGFTETNELGCNHSALVHELVETMLSICARLSKHNWACVNPSIKSCSTFVHTLAIALHVELLNVGWESNQRLTVRQDGASFDAAYIRVVKSNQAEHSRSILLQIVLAEIHVDII
jgi:hypothetical protein